MFYCSCDTLSAISWSWQCSVSGVVCFPLKFSWLSSQFCSFLSLSPFSASVCVSLFSYFWLSVVSGRFLRCVYACHPSAGGMSPNYDQVPTHPPGRNSIQLPSFYTFARFMCSQESILIVYCPGDRLSHAYKVNGNGVKGKNGPLTFAVIRSVLT